jgi:hypothetical protein
MITDLPESSFRQHLWPFGLKLVSYRRWLLGVIALSVVPYLQQRLIDTGVDWGWERFRGPQLLDGLWNVVAARPVPSVVVAGRCGFIVAATLSERHVRMAARPPVISKRSSGVPL